MGSNFESVVYNYEPLKQKEIVKLHKKFMKGNGPAGFKLASSVLPLLVSLAKRFYPQYLEKLGIEDFCQEILLFLAKRLPLYEESRGAFTTWAGWELRHFAADKFRRAGSLVKVPAHNFAKDYTEPVVYSGCDLGNLDSRELEPWEYASVNESIEQAKKLVDLMIKLSPEVNRETVRLHFVENMTYVDIAKVVKVTRQGVHQRCELAKILVKKHLRMKGTLDQK